MTDNNNQNSFYNMSTSEYMNNIASGVSYQTLPEDEYTDKLTSDYKPTAKKKKGFGRFLKRFAAVTASALLFGFVSAVMFNLVDEYFDDREDRVEEAADNDFVTGNDYVLDDDSDIISNGTIDTVSVTDTTKTYGMDVSGIVESVMPSVVAVNIKSIEEYNYGMFGGTYQYESEGSGSGIIIGENDTELLIVTNNHVVSDADTVSVSFIDESSYEAKVKGTNSDSDLAIIVVPKDKLSAETKAAIKIAKLGDSNAIKVGEQVVAIGNALGYGQSVTTGIVSAVNRTNSTNVTPLIQTDAAINPGNSGGALINMKGEVVGINSSKYMATNVEGMGYAIPISEIENILDDLMNRETRDKVDEDKVGYLGVGCATISKEASEMYGMPQGVLVSEVKKDSPAENAGIKKNNIIVEFDGIDIKDAEQLVDLLEYYQAGEEVTVRIAYLDDDEYKEKDIEVVLGRRAAANQ